MHSYLITPASEAEDQLLAALFQKMRVKAQVVPAPAGPPPAKRAASVAADKLIPRTPAEHRLVEAIEEMKDVMAGRKKAMTMEEFWKEVRDE